MPTKSKFAGRAGKITLQATFFVNSCDLHYLDDHLDDLIDLGIVRGLKITNRKREGEEVRS
jgi:hypothetical protein